MKRLEKWGIILFSCFLASCSNRLSTYYQSEVHENLVQETWPQQAEVNPNRWLANADSWLLTGRSNPREFSTTRSTTPLAQVEIKVHDFNRIKVSGNLYLQLAGHQEHNSVMLIGDNNDVRAIAIEEHNNTLFIHPDEKKYACHLNKVIIRIGIRNLRMLFNQGARISGRNITSDCLNIHSSNGTIMLAGDMNLAALHQQKEGSVTVIGAYTPNLELKVEGNGNVNLSGKVGVHSLIHQGSGSIHIIGADSDQLSISATGSGITTLSGYINLKKISASNNSQVYLYWISSDKGAYIDEKDAARVGLAGTINNLNLDIADTSRFEGQYLHAKNAYVHTRNWAHANMNADKKIFATASDNSSIYFFGSPAIISRYTTENGIVLPVWNDQTMTLPANVR